MRLSVTTYDAWQSDRHGWCPSRRPALQRALSWPELCRALTQFRDVPEKKAARSWSPVRLSQPRRERAYVAEVSCLVLDLDDGTPLDQVRAPWMPFTHLLHTSWSHTPEHPKARLVLPLAVPVPVAGDERLWRRVWTWAALVSPTLDRKCKDPSRLYFVPSSPSETAVHRWAEVHRGEVLDLRRVDLPPDPLGDTRARAPASHAGDTPRAREVSRLRALADRLKVDPELRAAAAVQAGARLTGGRAKGARCPGCGRPSVWWPLEPRDNPRAMCDHRNSCGWTGWIDQVVDLEGLV